MFLADLPVSLPADNVVLAQAAPISAEQQISNTITLENPWIVPRSSEWPYQKGNFAIDLARAACAELLQGYKFQALGWKSPVCKLVEITNLPKHGTLINEGNGGYGFNPAQGYLGTDSLQYLVEGQDGRRVLITLPIRVRTLADAVSFNDATTIQVDGSLAAWERQAQLSAVLAGASHKRPGKRPGEGKRPGVKETRGQALHLTPPPTMSYDLRVSFGIRTSPWQDR